MTLHRNGVAVAAAVGAAAALLAGPALAQTEESPFNGFYVGVTAGAGWGDTNSRLKLENPAGSTVIPPADVTAINNAQVSSGHNNHTGFVGGIEGGYNYVMGNFVLGAETDFGFFDIKQTKESTYQSKLLISPPITYTLRQKVHTDWVWTLRPRLGYVSGPWMFFGSAGIAVSDIKIETHYTDTFTPPGSASFSDSSTKTGFAGGVGFAYAFSPNWSAKGEWLYTDLGRISASKATPNNVAIITADAKAKSNLLRIGIDYKF